MDEGLGILAIIFVIAGIIFLFAVIPSSYILYGKHWHCTEYVNNECSKYESNKK